MNTQKALRRWRTMLHSMFSKWRLLYSTGTKVQDKLRSAMLVSGLRRYSTRLSRTVVQTWVAVTPRLSLRHNSSFKIHPNVGEALAERRPVVALESTIITHGMPYPENISMANEVEEIVRINGSVPATVGILKGKIHIGLSEEELKILATSRDCVKVSRRDLPYVLSQETEGVCVATFGDSSNFPAFFTPHSGFRAPCHVRNEEEAAQLIASSLDLRLGSGVLIAVPIPPEHAASGQMIEEAVQQALKEARIQGIVGKAVTPFLLRRVNELTGGKSLASNIALIKNNAAVGSRIAAALSKLQYPRDGVRKVYCHGESGEEANPDSRPVVIGGINVDFIAKASKDKLEFGEQTNPGQVHQSFGGVGRNLADCMSRLGARPLFISAIGQDDLSHSVLQFCSHMDMRGVARLKSHNTATYCAVITGSGELSLGLGDMEIHNQITESHVSQFADSLRRARLLCIDGNVSVSTIQYVCGIAQEHSVPVCYEPTDINKASKPFTSHSWAALRYISPNIRELVSINRTLGYAVDFGKLHLYRCHCFPASDVPPCDLDVIVETAIGLSLPLLENLHCVIVTLGAHGVLLCGHSCEGTLSLHLTDKVPGGDLCAVHYPAAPISPEEIINVSGAGDSLMAGLLSGVLAQLDTDTCVRMGLLAARLTLRSPCPISQLISTSSVSVQQVAEEEWPAPRVWNISPPTGKSFLRTSH
ncbi:uncharacterized protein LOC134933611 isoform X4 [Pseudophryne corroboree]|uniref:uncharacterized protein LOC134933611 isoform X4 n=1 Tax=Pseudophryne corroboree TaxID=495146 RepID=UPI003081E653